MFKFQKYILCAAIGLTAFGFSLGLLEIGRYFTRKAETKVQQTKEVRQLSVEDVTFPLSLPRKPDVPLPLEPETPSVLLSPELSQEYEFDPSGDYYISGELPKHFKDFEILSIETLDYTAANEKNDYQGIPIPPKGHAYTTRKFNFKRIFISSRKLSFETESVKGISYKFTGEFVEEVEAWGDYEEDIAIKGRLIKLRDNKKIAEAEVKLAVQHGC